MVVKTVIVKIVIIKITVTSSQGGHPRCQRAPAAPHYRGGQGSRAGLALTSDGMVICAGIDLQRQLVSSTGITTSARRSKNMSNYGQQLAGSASVELNLAGGFVRCLRLQLKERLPVS